MIVPAGKQPVATGMFFSTAPICSAGNHKQPPPSRGRRRKPSSGGKQRHGPARDRKLDPPVVCFDPARLVWATGVLVPDISIDPQNRRQARINALAVLPDLLIIPSGSILKVSIPTPVEDLRSRRPRRHPWCHRYRSRRPILYPPQLTACFRCKRTTSDRSPLSQNAGQAPGWHVC